MVAEKLEDYVAVPLQETYSSYARDNDDGSADHHDMAATTDRQTRMGAPSQGCPPIDIEFIDLTYTVPVGRSGK